MEHVRYIEDSTEYDYYRLSMSDLYKKLTIDKKTFNVLSIRNEEKEKLKNYHNGRMKSFDYVQLHCGFDIETTTIYNGYDDLHKHEIYNSFMYIWQFSFCSHGYQFVLKSNTWKDFEEFCRLLVSKLSKNQKVLVWVHNLPYEFSFMKGRFYRHFSDMFCKEHDKPIKFNFMEKLEFRDSMQLHMKGLKGLAEDFCQAKKLKGDLDFTIKRNHLDALNMTEREYRYCDNDVIILSQFDKYVWNNLIIGDTIPLTQTGILRSTIKQYLKDNGIYKRVLNFVNQSFPSKELYFLIMNYLFKGGFCGSNFKIVGDILENLDSFDFESSYPAIMLQPRYRFPRGGFHKNNDIKTIEQFKELAKEKCCFACFRFYDLKPKTAHNFISEHKIYNKSAEHIIVLNGKVRRVVNGFIEVFETEVDLLNYEKFYEWDNEKSCVVVCYESDRIQYGLDDYITKPLVEALVLKNTLKHQGKVYATEKAKLNSGYGMTTQKLITKEILFDSNSGTFEEKEIDDYNKMIKNRMFTPYIGIYITAYARNNLLNGIYAYHETTYGYDTDSMKGHFNDMTYINEYNEQCHRQNRIISEKFDVPLDIVYNLGCWDKETEHGQYLRYKTLGSKRYLYTTDNKTIHQTVCGLGDGALFKQAQKNNPTHTEEELVNDCFELFQDNMQIQDANKLLHSLQGYCEGIVNGVKMIEYSGTVLTPNRFTMKLEKVYANYIKQYHERQNKYEKRLL